MKGTTSLTHRSFPNLWRREILALLCHFSFGKKDVTKRRDHHGGYVPKMPSSGVPLGTERGRSRLIMEPLGCGKPGGITPSGMPVVQTPRGGRVSGNGTWCASKSSVTQKVGKTFLHHCPGTRGLHPPRTGDPALGLAPQVGGRFSPSAHPWCLESRVAQVREVRPLG